MTAKNNLPFDTILFDLDGTLYDSGQLDMLSIKKLMETDLGWDVDNLDIQKYLGVSSKELLEKIAPLRVAELLSKWLDYQNELREQTNLFPHVRSTLTELKNNGYKLGIVTSQNKAELDSTRAYTKMDDLIQVWVSASDAEFPKPHPMPVITALDRIGARAEQTIFIGDSLSDLEAGRSAGTQVGAVLWGAGSQKELIEFKPEFVFESVLELQNFVRNNRRGER